MRMSAFRSSRTARLTACPLAYSPNAKHTICFEVVTNSYGQEEIQAKEDTAQTLGMDIEFSKV